MSNPEIPKDLNLQRPSWDEYFLNIAQVVASRSTCFRRKVGAVIVHDKKIVSTGYNGSPRYQPSCAEVGYCYRDRHHIESFTQIERCRSVGSHAESNAICLAAKDGTATDGSTIYIYGHMDICLQCRGMIANCGINRAVIKRPDGSVEEFDVTKWTSHPLDNKSS